MQRDEWGYITYKNLQRWAKMEKMPREKALITKDSLNPLRVLEKISMFLTCAFNV